MSQFDGVSFGYDQIGVVSNNGPALYDNDKAIAQFYGKHNAYMGDVHPRPWSEDIDRFALSTKLAENQMRDSYKKREFMESSPKSKYAGCQCDKCKNGDMQVTYMFIFIMILVIILYYTVTNQINSLRDLIIMSSIKST